MDIISFESAGRCAGYEPLALTPETEAAPAVDPTIQAKIDTVYAKMEELWDAGHTTVNSAELRDKINEWRQLQGYAPGRWDANGNLI